MKNVIQPLAESVLIPLGLSTTASAAEAGIHKKILGSGTATRIILNFYMKGMIKIAKFLEDSGQILKRINETIQNEAKVKAG